MNHHFANKPALGPNHRWLVLATGAGAQASFAATFAGIPVLGILIRAEYGFSTIELGFVLSCMALGVGLSEILWGLLTDKLGDRLILLSGLLSMGLMLALMSLTLTPDHPIPAQALGLSLILLGALGASVNASSGRAVMTWFSDGKRGFAMSLRQTAVPAGGALGAALLPWLANQSGFSAVFQTLALFCFISAFATWRYLHEAPASTHPTLQKSSHKSPLLRFDIWRLALASGLLTVPQMAVLTFAGVFLHDEKQLSLSSISVLLVSIQLCGAAMRVWSGHYTDQHRNRNKLIRVIGLLTGISALLLALLSHAPALWTMILLCISGVLAHAWHGVAYTEIATMAGASHSGTALGITGTTIFTSAFLTPFLIPYLLTASSWGGVWLMAGLSALAAALLLPSEPRILPKPVLNQP